MTTDWREKLVECHPRKEDTDDYPFSISRLVKLIHEARRAALEEAAKEAETHGPHSCAMAGRTAGECVAESIRALAAAQKGTP